MRSLVKQTAFLLIVLGALTAPQAARAGEKEEARKHYDRAIELVDDNQLEGAIVEFQRSYELTHHFAVLYNIGQVFVSLAKPVEADLERGGARHLIKNYGMSWSIFGTVQAKDLLFVFGHSSSLVKEGALETTIHRKNGAQNDYPHLWSVQGPV